MAMTRRGAAVRQRLQKKANKNVQRTSARQGKRIASGKLRGPTQTEYKPWG